MFFAREQKHRADKPYPWGKHEDPSSIGSKVSPQPLQLFSFISTYYTFQRKVLVLANAVVGKSYTLASAIAHIWLHFPALIAQF